MRSALALFILSLAPLGCGRLDLDSEKERPKVEKALFEKAAIGFRGVYARNQPETADETKDSSVPDGAYQITP
jgi:hypothetical protein